MFPTKLTKLSYLFVAKILFVTPISSLLRLRSVHARRYSVSQIQDKIQQSPQSSTDKSNKDNNKNMMTCNISFQQPHNGIFIMKPAAVPTKATDKPASYWKSRGKNAKKLLPESFKPSEYTGTTCFASR